MRGYPVALAAEQQEGAGLGSPVVRPGPSLCTAESPQAQCPGLVYRNRHRSDNKCQIRKSSQHYKTKPALTC